LAERSFDVADEKQHRKADWVIFHEILETGNKTFIREITKIEKSWLLDDTLSSYYQVQG